MLRGPGEDEFRPHWLVLALDALGSGRHLEGLVVELVIDDERITLTGRDGRITAVDPGEHAPDVRASTDPGTVLGLASGALDPSTARAAMRIEPSGEDAERLLVTALSGAGRPT